MRYAILIALAAMMLGPAEAERAPQPIVVPDTCKNTPMSKATESFVTAFNLATAAYQAKDYGAALEALDGARPHASDRMQQGAILQLEIGALLGLDRTDAALPLLRGGVDDPCISSAARKNFRNILDKLEAETAADLPQ